MNIAEWKATADKKAVEQYEKDISWFRKNVKCCYNCENWSVSPELRFEYTLNFCKKHKRYMTKFDCYCSEYSGNCKIDNLIDFLHISWDVRKETEDD